VPTSLDKLKALSSRLENKLLEKTKDISSPELTVETKSNELADTAPIKPPIEAKKTQKPRAAKVKKMAERSFKKSIRDENIARIKVLYKTLEIFEKAPDFETIFLYKAMNLSGIGLKEDDFGMTREGKYIQIIAITYEPDKNGKKRAKNVSLRYFGKAEALGTELKDEIIEFVLRWRYEKAFQNIIHYENLLNKISEPISKGLF